MRSLTEKSGIIRILSQNRLLGHWLWLVSVFLLAGCNHRITSYNVCYTKLLRTLEGFRGSGADWLERYKPYIEDGKTVITSPHKVYGPESNDLALQLRKRGKSKILLAGLSANLCVEAHLRELLEQGFEVTVVKDA